MNAYQQKAYDYFMAGYNCSQSVFAAFADKMNMQEEDALRIASGLGGGVGRMREICGAVSGMALVLGNLYGYTDPDDKEQKTKLYAIVQECGRKFREKFGTVVCRELLGLQKNAKLSPVAEDRTPQFYKARPCGEYIVEAAGILAEVIEEMHSA